jgi:large subunit ribosomal protein L10
MPSEKVLEQKMKVVTELADLLKSSCSGVLVDYKGITVADDTKLRTDLREAGIKYAVVKNTLLKLAAQNASIDGLDSVLSGTTALATSADDYTSAARILSKFADTHKNFTVKSGFLDGDIISIETLARLAKLPSREILLASVCNVFNAPIAAFARSIQAIVDKDNEPVSA